jgi:hypothetical protein
MNKIKVLYDVFKTAKSKEIFKGEFKLEAEKDNATILNLTKEFEVNISKGNGRVKLAVEADYCGNETKHESSTEFNLNNCCDNKDLWNKIHGHHEDLKYNGIKGYLNRITFLLALLSKINLKEKEDGALLTLDLKDFCSEVCPECSKEVCCEITSDCCCGCECYKEFLNCDYDDAVLTIDINKKSDVEKVEVAANASDRKIKALLNLNW